MFRPRDSSEPEEPSRRLRRPRWRLLLVSAAAIGVLAWLMLIQGLADRDDLERARSAMEHGRDQFLAGDATGAAESFEHGWDLFEEADPVQELDPRRRCVDPGRNVDVLTGIADAGEATSGAAMVLSDAVAALPGGLQGLAPTGGAVPLERIPPLAEAGQTADERRRKNSVT
jgi:hypothetical protein